MILCHNKKMALNVDKSLFEKILIYNCLTNQTYLETVISYVKPTFFENENIQLVYKSILEYYIEYSKIPKISELKLHITDPEIKIALKDVILITQKIDKNIDYDVLLKITEKFIKEKTVLNTVKKTAFEIESGEIDTSKILKDFEKACSISLVENLGFDYLESIDQHCIDLQKTFKTISTGWKWLDEKLGGGFMADGKAFYLFFGATNVGKSIFLGNIATNILSQNKTVLLVTLEMPETVYAKRISAQISKIGFNDLKGHVDLLKEKLNNYKVKNKDSKLVIKEFPPKGITPLQLKAYINKLIRTGIKPDIIILDYLSLLSNSTIGKNSYETQKEIAEQVRSLSYEFNCSIVSAVQMNRDGYKQANPDLETTGESMGISHTVDAQISIWTEDGDVDLGIIHMGIVKNRFGPRQCSTVLEIDYPTLSLKDPDEVSNQYITPIPDEIKKININTQEITSTLELLQKLDN